MHGWGRQNWIGYSSVDYYTSINGFIQWSYSGKAAEEQELGREFPSRECFLHLLPHLPPRHRHPHHVHLHQSTMLHCHFLRWILRPIHQHPSRFLLSLTKGHENTENGLFFSAQCIRNGIMFTQLTFCAFGSWNLLMWCFTAEGQLNTFEQTPHANVFLSGSLSAKMIWL